VLQELILNFHGLGEPPDTIGAAERDVWVPMQWLEAILDAAPREGVVLTFDDGNVSDVQAVLPALTDRKLAARFFPLTGRIGTAGYLSAEDIAELSRLGEIVAGEITEAACPFGSYDRRVLRALRAAGYRRVFTSDGGPHASGAWLSSRTTVNRNRPLQHWLELARAGASKPLGLSQRGKRLLKRVR
jgi:peptidoglycan/xylan/chitin deacetylase (PgdA/CDA1 family)